MLITIIITFAIKLMIKTNILRIQKMIFANKKIVFASAKN